MFGYFTFSRLCEGVIRASFIREIVISPRPHKREDFETPILTKEWFDLMFNLEYHSRGLGNSPSLV